MLAYNCYLVDLYFFDCISKVYPNLPWLASIDENIEPMEYESFENMKILGLYDSSDSIEWRFH